MNRTTGIHSQGLENEGQNQKLTEQHAMVRALLHVFYFYPKMPKFSLVSSAT
jgi:hypothetical protein